MNQETLNQIIKKIRPIKCIAFDVDGIFTDCKIFMDSSGQWRRTFSIRDGYGIKRLIEANYKIAVITASKSMDIAERVKVLGIQHFYEGSLDKVPAFESIIKKENILESEMAYMGDDLFDLPLLKRAGFSATVEDAMDDVVSQVDYIAKRPAGNGAVREVCDLIYKWGANS